MKWSVFWNDEIRYQIQNRGSLLPWLIAAGSIFHEPRRRKWHFLLILRVQIHQSVQPLSICHAMANKRNTSRDIARPFVVCICSQPPRGISLRLFFRLRLHFLPGLSFLMPQVVKDMIFLKKKQTYLIAFPNLTYSLLPSLSLYIHIFELKYSIGRPVAF